MRRGLKSDGLIQAQIKSLVTASSGGLKLNGLVKTYGKRKFSEVNNPTSVRKAARRD